MVSVLGTLILDVSVSELISLIEDQEAEINPQQ